jgi:hypothetical protein
MTPPSGCQERHDRGESDPERAERIRRADSETKETRLNAAEDEENQPPGQGERGNRQGDMANPSHAAGILVEEFGHPVGPTLRVLVG